jgi:hypothetical protein
MQQRLGEQDNQPHKEREERKVDKVSTMVNYCFFKFFSQQALAETLTPLTFFVSHSQKETTIRYQESVKSLQVHIGASKHSNEEISVIQTTNQKRYRRECNDIGIRWMTLPKK